MRDLSWRALPVVLILLGGCQSAGIREKCAASAAPDACEKAEYERSRLVDPQQRRRRWRRLLTARIAKPCGW
jgi:hypothetical protein